MDKELKNSKKTLWIFITLLLLVTFSATGFFAGKWYANKESKTTLEKNEQKEEQKNEEKIEEKLSKPEKNSMYTFYSEKEETIKLGDNELKLLAYYYLDTTDLVYEEQTSKYYILRRQLYANNTLVAENIMDISKNEITKEDINKKNLYEKKDTFNDITNKDKYLVIELESIDYALYNNNNISHLGDYESTTYVINKEGKILKNIASKRPYYGIRGIIVDSSKVGDRVSGNIDDVDYNDPETAAKYKGKKYIYPDNNFVDVHDNFIYYIAGDCDRIFEHKFSINNGSTKDETTKTYFESEVDAAGGC